MPAYYNEIEPFAAAWLRNLIAGGHIAPGDVDERDIRDVRPDDLRPYTQCHFFAGIGVWSYALRRAGWPDDRAIWTGSCPCQPFSAAGKGTGFADERHLWPAFHHLIRVRRPDVVVGEQVASSDGLEWLDLVQADLEGEAYACGPVDTCAAGFGAPHWRQRLYWLAHRDGARGPLGSRACGIVGRLSEPAHYGAAGELADANGRDASAERLQRSREHGQQSKNRSSGQLGLPDGVRAGRHGGTLPGPEEEGSRQRRQARYQPDSPDFPSRTLQLGDGVGPGSQVRPLAADEHGVVRLEGPAIGATGTLHGPWADADWLYCTDGRWRPVEPGTRPLAHGAASRVGRLRAYGNALCAAQAEGFVRTILSIEAEPVRLGVLA